ncbi:uncharacterized protein SAZU_6389 [Streptomyces azureus]|uniref:Uncharacterized protein n=1 Tax=Streptomyces azureus TaxID=146537 RepID=A0A0K8PUH5_STRAJ|nr:uncharacterized protein SAZU_6389 [Streptomyces azureus]
MVPGDATQGLVDEGVVQVRRDAHVQGPGAAGWSFLERRVCRIAHCLPASHVRLIAVLAGVADDGRVLQGLDVEVLGGRVVLDEGAHGLAAAAVIQGRSR